MTRRLGALWRKLREGGALMVGVPDYDRYVAHMRAAFDRQAGSRRGTLQLGLQLGGVEPRQAERVGRQRG